MNLGRILHGMTKEEIEIATPWLMASFALFLVGVMMLRGLQLH